MNGLRPQFEEGTRDVPINLEEEEICQASHALTKSQQRALDAALRGENMFITGRAGTGKTYLVGRIYRALRAADKEVLLLASTGTAALNLSENIDEKAYTAHSGLGIPVGDREIIDIDENNWGISQEKRVSLPCFDAVIIDEISMLRLDAFGRAMQILDRAEGMRGGRPIQRIVIGDMLQLSPVVTSADKVGLNDIYDPRHMYPFDASRYEEEKCLETPWEQQRFRVYELTEVMRTDEIEFSQALSRIRIGDVRAIPWINAHAHIEGRGSKAPESATRLFGRNAEVDEYNEMKLQQLVDAGERKERYAARVIGNLSRKDWQNVGLAKQLNLAKGARVRIMVNAPSGSPTGYEQQEYVNGSFGTYIGKSAVGIKIKLDNGKTVHIKKISREILGPWYVADEPIDFDNPFDDMGPEYEKPVQGQLVRDVVGVVTQYPIALAWAITVHRAQGITLDEMRLDPYTLFAPGHLYVAISRLTSIEGLWLSAPLQDRMLRCDEHAKNVVIHDLALSGEMRKIPDELLAQVDELLDDWYLEHDTIIG